MLSTMKKMNQANSDIHEYNREHVSESGQHRGEGISFSKLKARVSRAWGRDDDVIDVADYAILTVRTDFGIYQTGDCERYQADGQKADCPSTVVIYGAECRLEGHVRGIKGRLDEIEDGLHLRISDQDE